MRLHGIGNDDAWKRYSRAGSWEYQVVEAGYKFNLPDILAAVGQAQLRKCDTFFQNSAGPPRNSIAASWLK